MHRRRLRRCGRRGARSPSSTTPGCSVVDKQTAAVAEGAVGLLVVSARPDAATPGCSPPATTSELEAPVARHRAARRCGAAPHQRAGTAGTRRASRRMVTSRNVLAQTKTGDHRNVVVAGAHLDSVAAQPRHQRQRHGGGRGAGDRRRSSASRRVYATPCGSPSGARRRSAWRVAATMSGPGARPARRHRAVPELRHARLAQRRATSPTTATSPALDPDVPAATSRRARPASSARWRATSTSPGIRPADMPLGLTAPTTARS